MRAQHRALAHGSEVSAGAQLSRRHALLGGLAACSLPAFGVRAQTPLRAWATDEVAPGIHIRRGVDEDISATNDDAIANIGFIIGREAVAVTDSGGSLNDGRRLRMSIRQATALPIRYVLMSHVHPDHVFGAGAFSADHPVYVGHAGLPRALSLRWEYYRARTEALLGKDTVGAPVTPTLLVHERAQIDLGGRVLELTAHGIAHTDSDLSALDRQTGTLIASDLLFVRRVPSLDGSLKGWLKELALLKGVAAKRAVPGHGPTSVDWPLGCRDLERYLGVLLRETRAAIKQGHDIEAAVKTVGQSERARWALFDDYNGHNVIQAFKELEWE
ncbi:MAG TPA: quinoprotein relay system zinc metallohydrolase 2 [Steroidobacteraceae bacterium]|nr:quinoprotein relay system zinc metallohydrolase 2 [Steroidobacteraceae bacterium]